MATIIIDPALGIDAPEISAPATPDTGRRRLYAKSDGWYDQDDAGTETKIVSGAVDHGGLSGLGDDDHTQYAEIANAETITGLHTFDLDPSAPFAVSSGSAVVTNLDADLLDGQHASAFAAAAHNHGTNGVVTKQSTADVSNPPTDAELDSAFGDPATLGDGFVGVLDDAGAATTSYLVWTASGAWFYAAGTKAT